MIVFIAFKGPHLYIVRLKKSYLLARSVARDESLWLSYKTDDPNTTQVKVRCF